MNKILMIAALSMTAASAQTMNMNTAEVRVVHASPDAPAVDVYVDGMRTVSGAAFKAVTPYGDVPAGKHHVVITVAGDKSKKVIETDVDLKAGTYYTVAAVNKVADLKLAVFTATGLNMNKGKAQLNVYHLSPGAPNVDVLAVDLDNFKVVNNLPFGRERTVLVNPMGVNVNIVPAGKMEPVVANLKGISVAGGKSYSVFAFGIVGGKGDMAFAVIPNEDKVVADSMAAK